MESTLDFSTLLFRVVGSLALVLAALLAVWYLCKKTGRLPAQGMSGNGIRLVARKAVGPRHQLIMVEAADHLLLLGLSPEGLRLLSPLGTVTAHPQGKSAALETEEPQPAFADIVHQLTGGSA